MATLHVAQGTYARGSRFQAKLLIGSASIAALMLGAAGAAAQTTQQNQSFGIEEIVVTAQKREQNVQDVPVAVTAVSAETLQVNRVQNIMDLNGLAPGLMARANAGSTGSPSYSMRGIFASGSDPAQDRQIATYVDGVYIGGIRGAIFDLPDMQRVEVLRGPQGTLFGRNATAGAISITTRDPTGDFRVRAEASLGTYNSLRTRLTVDTPQIGSFSGFVTYVHDERRGDIRNVGAGTRLDFTSPLQDIKGVTRAPQFLGSKNAESFFGALRFEPSDNFSVVYKYDNTKNDSTPEARVPLYNSPLISGIIALQGGDTTYGGYVMQADPEKAQRPKVVNNAFSAPGYSKASGHLITTNFQVSDNLSFKNVTSWRKAGALGISSIMGVDGLTVTPGVIAFLPTFPIPVPGVGTVPLPLYTPAQAGQLIVGYGGINYGKYNQFSNEFQANFDSDFVTVTAGALYFKSRELQSGLNGSPTNYGLLIGLGGIPQALGAFFAGGPGAVAGTIYAQNLSLNTNAPFLLGNVQEKRQRSKSLAAYVQGEFHVTPELDIVLGGRVTRDEKSQTFVQGGAFNGTAIVGASSVTTPFKKTKPTYSIGANYKVSPDMLVYGKYSTAYLSGGASGPLTFQPENVASWEAGLKSEFLDRRVRLNLAVYTAKYKDTQSAQGGSNVQDPACGTTGLPVSCSNFGVLVVSNGDLRSTGVEAELTVAPVRGLTFGGSVSYSKNKLLSPSPQLTDGGRPVAVSGVAPWMGGANAQYVTPELFDGTTMLFRLDANYQGKYRNSPFRDIATNTTGASTVPAQAPYTFNSARWIINGRIALRDMQVGPMEGEIALWGRNLTNNKDVSYLLMFGSQNVNASFQQARTIGLEFILDL